MEKQIVLMQVASRLRDRFADSHFVITDVAAPGLIKARCGNGQHLYAPLLLDLEKTGGEPMVADKIRSAGFCGPIIALSTIPQPVVDGETYSDDYELIERSFLENGGDRLIRSPYSGRLVEEVVEAMRRRVTPPMPGKKAGPLVREVACAGVLLSIDEHRAVAAVNRQPLVFTVSELKVYGCLLRRPGTLWSRDSLREEIAKNEYAEDRTIDSFIKRIRRKMEQATPGSSKVIESVYGGGYRLTG